MQHTTITTDSLETTLRLGENIGLRCVGGEVLELISDLGGGKTAFVRGLSKGLGTDDEVSSPSFTINNTYKGPKLTLEHFDFYRLESAGVMADELREDLYDKHNVVAVEWGDIVHDILPVNRVVVKIVVDEKDRRIFNFSYPINLKYLFEGLK